MALEDAKRIKKEDAEDDEADNESLSSLMKKKVTSMNGNRVKKEKTKHDDVIKKPVNANHARHLSEVKDEEVVDEDDDEKPVVPHLSAKLDKKTKIKVEVMKRATAIKEEQNGKKKERKVYELPGQKRDPPEKKDALRIFYESLYKQIPTSEMAQFWMMESGLLPKEEALRIFNKKAKKSQLQKLTNSPAKKDDSISPNKKKTSQSNALSKKRKTENSSSDDDFECIAKRLPKNHKAKQSSRSIAN